MPDDKDRQIIPSQGGMLNDLAIRIKLIMRLMADRRVSPLLKLLPIGSLAYFLIPDLVLGPVDDVAVIWLGAYLFVELAPQDIVDEHMRELTGQLDSGPTDLGSSDTGSTGTRPPDADEDVIEGEFWEKKD